MTNSLQRAQWALDPYDSFDTETTGVNVEEDRIVTATILALDPRSGSVDKREWLIDPGVEIPEGATKVHGITTEHAREHGQDPASALPDIHDALRDCWDNGRVLVIYNAPYDLTILDRELRRYGFPSLGVVGPVFDPLVIDKQVNRFVRGKGARQLTPTAKRYGIELTEAEAHTSAGDALAAARLTWKMASLPAVRSLGTAELNERQRRWYQAQQESFAQYLERKGSEGDPEGAGRIRAEAARGYPLRAFVDEFAGQGEPPW